MGPSSDLPGLAGEDGDGPDVGPSRISWQVAEFHRAYQLEAADIPTVVGPAVAGLRQALIDEEVDELRAAAARSDVVGIADALADIVYVAYGTARVYGIDLDAVLDEVHSSNMTKLGADGRPIRRADGKVLKGPGYRPPDIAAVLGLHHLERQPSGRQPTGAAGGPTSELTE
jgi:predicted HAD superfamily Cof-like phosphohydrolase